MCALGSWAHHSGSICIHPGSLGTGHFQTIGAIYPIGKRRGLSRRTDQSIAYAQTARDDFSRQICNHPDGGRIRLAGLLEFAGLDAPDNPKAVDYLTRHIAKYLPHVRYDDMKVWHGFRPTTANSYPVIGRPAHLSNAHVGLGISTLD